jgi:acylphosphatase
MTIERRRIRFSGRVQGVGFRAAAKNVANRHVLTGWIRNEPDGSVLMEVQGETAEIESCLSRLRERMSGFIRSETTTVIAPLDGESSFEIRH